MTIRSNRSFDDIGSKGGVTSTSAGFRGLMVRGAEFAAFFVLALGAVPALADGKPIGSLGSIIGKAQILRGDKSLPATKGMAVFASDSLVTADKTAVKIQFEDGGTFMAFENAKVKIEEYKFKAGGEGGGSLKSAFEIAKGKVRFFVKPQPKGSNDTKYKTANAVMGIRGTSGFIDASKPGQTQLVVLTGKVEVSNPASPNQKVIVPANQMTEVTGRAGVPTPPKPAPVALMTSLNSEANRVDPKGNGGEQQPQKPDEKKADDKKADDKKSAPASQGGNESGSTSPGDGPAAGSANGTGVASEANATPGGAPEGVQGAEPAPVQVDRKAIYSPDGSSTISVNDDKLNSLTTPSISTRSPVNDVAAKALAAPAQAVQQVQSSVTENTDRAVQNQVDKAAKAAAAEDPNRKKTVKVKIVLPNSP